MSDSSDEPRLKLHTLDRWVGRLLKIPCTIECPVMHVLGYDHEPPLFAGPGYISIRSRTQMKFVMHATPKDGGEAFNRLMHTAENPHSVHDQFRVVATAYDGTEWNCGWTTLQLGEFAANVWRLSGPLHSLMADVSGRWVSPESSVEVVYDTMHRLPTPMNMVTSVKLGDDEVLWACGPGSKIIKVAGTKIEFFHAVESDVVWATAKTSALFPHPFAENWISEPLRLLLGQLIFPRLVARNKGDGSAMIWLRPSPPHTADTLTCSILGEDPYAAHGRFWELYHDILTMVVHAKDASGDCNFEAHPLTRYYHEIVQASTGSHWVLCMTLASMIEGVTKMLVPPEERRSDFDPSAIEDLMRHIRQWTGDKDLRSRILGSVVNAEEKGIVQSLKALCRSGTLELEPDHISTWRSVRNQVMHGNLVSPWMDEEMEQQLQWLTELAHSLSAAYIRKCVSSIRVR